MIEFRELTVAYGRTVAIDHLTAVIPTGITGLFGQNGSGKTTLLRALAGLLKPREGTVAINGSPLDLSDESFRQNFGYAGHESGLYPHLTLLENLELMTILYGVESGRADHVSASLGLADHRTTLVGALSAGMKRRASVARALLHDPKVLLLDEPYANLDDDAADLVSEAVKDWSELDRTAVIATHGAKRVKAYATGGLILQRGRIVTQGKYVRAESR